MQPFSDGETRVLVCTDLASRGIHNDKVTKTLCKIRRCRAVIYRIPPR